MNKVWLIGVLALGLGRMDVSAKDDAAGGKADRKPAVEQPADLQELTLTGTVKKIEKKKKDGSVMMTWYALVDKEGREIHLPKGKVEEFDGLQVKITAQGLAPANKKPVVKTVTSIEKVAAP